MLTIGLPLITWPNAPRAAANMYTVRSGMIDETGMKTWQLFYRNAVIFSVTINQADIAGTPFEQRWRPFVIESGDHRAIKGRM